MAEKTENEVVKDERDERAGQRKRKNGIVPRKKREIREKKEKRKIIL